MPSVGLKELMNGYKNGQVTKDFIEKTLVKDRYLDGRDVILLAGTEFDSLIPWKKLEADSFCYHSPKDFLDERIIKLMSDKIQNHPDNCTHSNWYEWIAYFGDKDASVVIPWFKRKVQPKYLPELEGQYESLFPKLSSKALETIAPIVLNNPPRIRMTLLYAEHLPDKYIKRVLAGFTQVKEWSINGNLAARIKKEHLEGLQVVAQMRILDQVGRLINGLPQEFVEGIILAGLFQYKDLAEVIRRRMTK